MTVAANAYAYLALFDACVLAPMPVCDTVLRLAEAAFYIPKWSPSILHEVESTISRKFNYTPEQAKRRTTQMQAAFEDALITGYESLIPQMKNDEKDRHVVAAAIVGGVDVIVTDNIRHFPESALAEYSLQAQPSDFLVRQYSLDPDLFIEVLKQQATQRGRSLPELLKLLKCTAPKLAKLLGG